MTRSALIRPSGAGTPRSSPGWARAHADDRERYTDEKAIFVTGVLRDLDGPDPSGPTTAD